jgi:hypothetical protein
VKAEGAKLQVAGISLKKCPHASAGLYMTAPDLAKLDSALHSRHLLSRASRRSVQNVFQLEPTSCYSETLRRDIPDFFSTIIFSRRNSAGLYTDSVHLGFEEIATIARRELSLEHPSEPGCQRLRTLC